MTADVTRQRPDVAVSGDIKPPSAPRQRPTVKSARTGRPPVPVGTRHNGRIKRADGRWMTDRQWQREQTAARAARHVTDRVFVPIHPVDRAALEANARALGYSPPHYAGELIHAALLLHLGHVVNLATAAQR